MQDDAPKLRQPYLPPKSEQDEDLVARLIRLHTRGMITADSPPEALAQQSVPRKKIPEAQAIHSQAKRLVQAIKPVAAPPVIVELFSGHGQVAMMALEQGCGVAVQVDIDPEWHPTICGDIASEFDMIALHNKLDKWRRRGHMIIFHLSPPCEEFSRMRTTGGKRNIPYAVSVVLAAIRLAQSWGAAWVLENPATGSLWEQPEVQSVLKWTKDVDYCRYGHKCQKQTRLAFSSKAMREAFPALKCLGAGRCLSMSRRHGSDQWGHGNYDRLTVAERVKIPDQLAIAIATSLLDEAHRVWGMMHSAFNLGMFKMLEPPAEEDVAVGHDLDADPNTSAYAWPVDDDVGDDNEEGGGLCVRASELRARRQDEFVRLVRRRYLYCQRGKAQAGKAPAADDRPVHREAIMHLDDDDRPVRRDATSHLDEDGGDDEKEEDDGGVMGEEMAGNHLGCCGAKGRECEGDQSGSLAETEDVGHNTDARHAVAERQRQQGLSEGDKKTEDCGRADEEVKRRWSGEQQGRASWRDDEDVKRCKAYCGRSHNGAVGAGAREVGAREIGARDVGAKEVGAKEVGHGLTSEHGGAGQTGAESGWMGMGDELEEAPVVVNMWCGDDPFVVDVDHADKLTILYEEGGGNHIDRDDFLVLRCPQRDAHGHVPVWPFPTIQLLGPSGAALMDVVVVRVLRGCAQQRAAAYMYTIDAVPYLLIAAEPLRGVRKQRPDAIVGRGAVVYGYQFFVRMPRGGEAGRAPVRVSFTEWSLVAQLEMDETDNEDRTNIQLQMVTAHADAVDGPW